MSGKAEEVLPFAVAISRECYTFRTSPKGDPFAIFGVMEDPANENMGVVWFLATSATVLPLAVMQEAPAWLNHWSRLYPDGLHNIVDSRNTSHVRWMELLGFHLGRRFDLRGVEFIHAIRS